MWRVVCPYSGEQTKPMSNESRQSGSAKTIFLIAVALSAAAVFSVTVVRGDSMIDMMAALITKNIVPINATIMFLFAVIVSLTLGVVVHYYIFELRQRYIYDQASAKRLADITRRSELGGEERMAEARRVAEQDPTLFALILRRFIGERGFAAPRPFSVWQAIQDEEFDRVKRNLMYLSLASVVSPAIGFLGTAVGMVAAFYEISIKDTVTPSDLALSIQIALITTVVGLIIKTIAMLLKTAVIHSIGRREDQLTAAYTHLFEG